MAIPTFYKALTFTDSSSFEMQNNVIIHKEVNANFKLMANGYKTDKGKDILVEQSYISIFQHYDELRKAVTTGFVNDFYGTIKVALNLNVDIITAAGPDGKGLKWTQIKKQLENLPYETDTVGADYFNENTGVVWENPINSGVLIPKPNQIIQPGKAEVKLIDPRRTGRWVQTTPGIIPGDYAWFLNNSAKFGFIPYGPSNSNMLFYITLAEVKAAVPAGNNEALKNLVTIFTPIASGDTSVGKVIKDQITTTADVVLKGPPPPQSRGGGKGFSQTSIASITNYLRTKYSCSNVFIAACCAIASKESGGVPKNEYGWGSTIDLGRIRTFFGNRLKKPGWSTWYGQTEAPSKTANPTGLTDPELIALKANDLSFFDKIYGPGSPHIVGSKATPPGTPASIQGGNIDVKSGYDYRGRGFNGITFKTAYQKYNPIIQATYKDMDIVATPDKLNDPADGFGPSAIALGEYMYSNVGNLTDEKITKILTYYRGRVLTGPVNKALYKSTNSDHCIRACMHANAGWGTNPNDGTWMSEGEGKALANYPTLLAAVESVK